MPIHDAVAHIDKHQHLNTAQRAAVEQILTSRNQVQGYARVGKLDEAINRDLSSLHS
jgi:hypothetical protein